MLPCAHVCSHACCSYKWLCDHGVHLMLDSGSEEQSHEECNSVSWEECSVVKMPLKWKKLLAIECETSKNKYSWCSISTTAINP